MSIGLILVALATVALVVFVRLRLADLPLERDEGEYAYAGQLILEGVPPYELVYNMKFPGTYYAYAALMAIFGQTAWGIRVGLLFVNLATAALLYALGRRVAGPLAAAIGACAFLLLTLDRWVMGVFAHATHFVLLPAVAALLVLQTAHRTGRAWQFVASGFLAGLAVVMKQHALFLTALTVLLAMRPVTGEVLSIGSRLRRGALAAAGVVAAIALVVLALALSGVLGRFWFWTFQYASEYVSQVAPGEGVQLFRLSWLRITQASIWWWYAAGAGVVLLFLTSWPRDSRVMISAWLVAAGLAIAPGLYFREHYFILVLPVVGLLVGVAIASMDRIVAARAGAVWGRAAALGVFAVLAGVYVARDAPYLFRMSPGAIVREVYGTNPFLESPEIARYLNAHTTPDDRVAILGSEPQILFYAHRRSATGYIYMYSLMETQQYAQRMQDEMMREVEAARPMYLVFVGVSTSWLASPEGGQRVLGWANAFTAKCYERVGVADIFPDPLPTLRWDADSLGYQPRSSSQVLTFRRRAGCDTP